MWFLPSPGDRGHTPKFLCAGLPGQHKLARAIVKGPRDRGLCPHLFTLVFFLRVFFFFFSAC